ncbi:MAG TPA: amino acid permease [Caulobacteraceae bacterium]|nr:amino acid permease [Caulobacteraceae bacterium]
MSYLTRRKPIETDHAEHHRLKRTLGWAHLTALGVGAIVGTGIYTLTGVGAGMAGPAFLLSFLIAGAVCACAALCYAEMATLMPQAGSAYAYSYAVMGETTAWVVGWSLILEYTVVCAAVSVGWAGYAAGLIRDAGLGVPEALLAGPGSGGVVNLPAILIALAVAVLLALGTRESARINFVLVIVKLAALAGFILLAAPAFDPANFQPFMPHGWSGVSAEGVKLGVLPAAALIFFAFYGFDAISTAAEEARRPERDLTIAIVGSMALCTAIYMAVAAAAIGASPVAQFAASDEPLAFVLRALNHPLAAALIAGAAVVALPTVIMVFMFGQSRVFFAMARDRLLPPGLARVHPRFGTPVAVTLLTGVIAAAIAGFLPLKDIAELANAGTLAAFVAVAISVILLRLREPGRERRFKTPLWQVIAPAAVLGCLYLFWSLPAATQLRFLVWNAVGLGVYLLYGRTRSALA